MSKKPSFLFFNSVVSPKGIKGIAVLLLIIILLSFGIYLNIQKPEFVLSPDKVPRTIPKGKIGFTVSQSDSTVPQFGKGFIDPYNPKKRAVQTVTVAVKHKGPVTKVKAVLKTDHKISAPVDFRLINGTSTDGEWQGSWKITDTYYYKYSLILMAESSESSASVEITLR